MSRRRCRRRQAQVQLQRAQELLNEETLQKYRELYAYSTELLVKEHDRFNRADEKAAKYSTMFVFLMGISGFFGKWILDRLKWPEFPTAIPSDRPLFMAGVAGLLALLSGSVGLFLSNHVIKLRPVVSRPLNKEMLDFFENQSRLNIYYGLAKENTRAYERNRRATDEKYILLKWSYRLMVFVVVLLGELVVMYCLYSWC